MKQYLDSILSTLRRVTEPNAETLAQSIELEETEPPHVFTALIGIICGLMGFAILWSGLTRIDELTRAQGVVMPAGDVVAIQHLEGGLVAEINVIEGQMVEAGAPLLRLAPLDTENSLNQISQRRAFLALSIERISAQASGRRPDFDAVIAGQERLKEEQLTLFEAEAAAAVDRREVLKSQSEQKHSEIVRLENQVSALERNARIVREEYDVRAKLLEDGLTTRDRYYSAKRELQQVDRQLADIRDQLLRAINEGLEAQERLEEFDSTQKSDLRAREADLRAELAEVEESLKSISGRSDRLVIAAPVAGIVKGLTVTSVNTVARAGETLMEIVPVSDRMVVSARISPQEIGHIHTGQVADVRVATYDFSTYGSLNGVVELISASTFQDERGEAYYEAIVGLDRIHFGPDPDQYPILPGMSVEADIKTGSKSLLSYMLKPVNRGWSNAFRER
ncbi:MAG: HlyD family type I secretion periplasmic adaptor subunit [Pseudomonadota bacterium]